MKFNDYIFNEMHTINPTDNISNPYIKDQVLPNINKICKLQDENLNTDILIVEQIPKESLLYKGLIQWFGNTTKLQATLRDFYQDSRNIYFVHGIGYNYISSDLLGGIPDKTCEENFVDTLNNDRK